ncbi:MAG TPA: methyltransferase domain-containing protein [Planctomycetota bacterium]
MATREMNRLDPESDAAGVAEAVRERYAASAVAREARLCCPIDYDARYLAVLPAEILERDYGCGDPSRWVRPGERVLDLGSGAGKICFIASQVVGAAGRVIGVDMTSEMLDLARRFQPEIATSIGFDNVEFRRGRIEDLQLDLDKLGIWLAAHPVRDLAGHAALQAETARLRREEPLVADACVDVVVSNCVLNLVASGLKQQLFAETYRVLAPGGRAVISDIVADCEVPLEMQADPELWSGCISGALEEGEFLRAFRDAGFHGVQIVARQEEPWQVVDDIVFRSVTVAAYKDAAVACGADRGAVVYLGPFDQVHDDQGLVWRRGESVNADAETLDRLRREPYAAHFSTGVGTAAAPEAAPAGGGCC